MNTVEDGSDFKSLVKFKLAGSMFWGCFLDWDCLWLLSPKPKKKKKALKCYMHLKWMKFSILWLTRNISTADGLLGVFVLFCPFNSITLSNYFKVKNFNQLLHILKRTGIERNHLVLPCSTTPSKQESNLKSLLICVQSLHWLLVLVFMRIHVPGSLHQWH